MQVIVCDSNAEQIKKGSAFMDKLFERDVQKGKITAQEAEEARSRVKVAEDGIPGLRDVDMVMEVSCVTFNIAGGSLILFHVVVVIHRQSPRTFP